LGDNFTCFVILFHVPFSGDEVVWDSVTGDDYPGISSLALSCKQPLRVNLFFLKAETSISGTSDGYETRMTGSGTTSLIKLIKKRFFF
jgi:hypothetical protein